MVKRYLLLLPISLIVLVLIVFTVFYVAFLQEQKNDPTSEGEQTFVSWFKKKTGAVEEDTVPTFENPSPEFVGNMGIEQYTVLVVKRGSFINFDERSKILQIADDFTQNKENITVDTAKITDVTCWPEVVTNPDGSTTLLREAYIPFAPKKPLSWPGQQVRKWENISPTLDASSYVFARLEEPHISSEDAAIIPSVAAQIVVLGC